MFKQLEHPLVATWLTELRDVETSAARFRAALRRLSMALFLEASGDLPVEACGVRTPLAKTSGLRLAAAPLLVPVLRAGLGMVEPILELVPEARVCHIGLYRDHQTLEAVRYYTPEVHGGHGLPAFVLEPMLATGGSAAVALAIVREWRPSLCRLLSIIAAPEGVARVREQHPEVEILLCALDERLNEVGYILPGLGDAGDRQFGG